MSDIHITRWGTGGRRVIMVHGSAQGSTVGGDKHFERQAALAGQGWELIVPDRPGHGRSRSPGRPDDAEADAIWVAELIGDGAHLVGHSFGGAVVLAAAALQPDKVHSLTIIEPAMQKFAMSHPAVRKFGLQLASTMIFSLSAKARAQKFARIVGIPEGVRGGSSDAEWAATGRGIAKLKVPAKADIARELAVVRAAQIPFLVVTGGWHPAFEATSDAVAEAGGGSRLVIKSEHHFPHNVSDEFNDKLAAFMVASDAARAR